MKRLYFLIAFAVASVSFASCDLEIDPDTSLSGADAADIEFVNGMRLGVYSSIKGLTSGGYLYYADYMTDLFNETRSSGNRGGFFARHLLYDSDQDVNAMWNGYYSTINDINYALKKLAELEQKDTDGVHLAKTSLYKSELHFFRAYIMHQLALRFCNDYEPDLADTQLGVPTPAEYNPDAQLNRGTLAETYEFILNDIEVAEAGLGSVTGSSDSIYLTADALTAFKAQVALQMHDYANASTYASSLYAYYPLLTTSEDLEKMWREDISSETIFQPEVRSTSLGTVGSMSDYYAGSWSAANGIYICQPAYALAQMPVNLYAPNDIRYGNYIAPSMIYYSGNSFEGMLMTKFLGNKSLQTVKTTLTYRNAPKVFRVAEMYLIDAEAQYRLGEDAKAAAALNILRQARGLEATTATGEDLFAEIKNERVREMIGEGHRLTDLKRWHDGFVRDFQPGLQSVIRGQLVGAQTPADKYMFTWPIPQEELSNNLNFGAQNLGY